MYVHIIIFFHDARTTVHGFKKNNIICTVKIDFTLKFISKRETF